jgi:hypothetical protein
LFILIAEHANFSVIGSGFVYEKKAISTPKLGIQMLGVYIQQGDLELVLGTRPRKFT